ncbi:PREDICTED: putative F-box protein At2g04810 [Camelina sativa]|uniref:F-box protein At2g04810 n=1 Tax=Camelina sativa TaxID=90675 RepID=A0ABM0W821_CAMSA|nr:PREDICTED: putative F-box protein At2g04810 [Camelina sativa]
MENGVMRKKKKRPRVSRYADWSNLSPDVLRKIFETLRNPVDSHRAKRVCSNWYSVWKTCANKPPCPGRIIHLGDSPTVEENTVKLGRLTHNSYCMATFGNWLLMVDLGLHFYILNFSTRRRINLPSMHSPIRGGKVTFEPGSGYFLGPNSRKDKVPSDFDAVEWKNSVAVLWIDETTGEYVVAWTFKQHYLFTYKNGDGSWCNLNHDGRSMVLFDMACEKNKLYLYTANHHIRIFDFFEYYPTAENFSNQYWNHPFDFVEQEWEYVWKRKLAIRESGEVLIILSLKQVLYEEALLFYIFKMNLESFKWERVYSIGDEMLSFGHGVTVALSLEDLGCGTKRDSIYFVDKDVWPDHQDHEHRVSNCGVFDIATGIVEWPKQSYFSINKTQWFVGVVAY